MEIMIFWSFLLAILLGAIIGLEREIPTIGRKEGAASGIGGVRSYAFMSFLGALMTWLDIQGNTGDLWKIIGFLTSAIFLMISYTYASFHQHRMGVTSEYAAFMTYLLGVLVMLGYNSIAVVLTILMLVLLSAKDKLQGFQARISREEIGNTIKFAVISLVILPLLPDQKYSIADGLNFIFGRDIGIQHDVITMAFFNPFSIWFFVVIMAGVEYVGYLLSKTLGNRGGAVLSGMVGGLISSTAVTAAMSSRSHDKSQNTYAYVSATLFASIIMCVRVIVISAFYSPPILSTLLAPAIMMLVGLAGAAWYYYEKDRKTGAGETLLDVDEGYASPFRLLPALKFALVVVAVKFIAGIGIVYQDVINEKIFYYALGAISGLADVDAITMDMASKSHDGSLAVLVAATTILIATTSNNIVKGSLAWRFGEKKFGQSVAKGFGFSIALGMATLIVMNLLMFF